MKILGISAFYHDSAAALIVDGNIAAAAQEERFTRKRHDAAFPTGAIEYCLQARKIEASEIDQVVFYDKPFLKFERLLETYLAFAPKGFFSFAKSLPVWVEEKLFQKKLLLEQLSLIDSRVDWEAKIRFSEHHVSHAASAFYPSPFREAAVLVLDGVGEWATSSIYLGSNKTLEPKKVIRFPHSLGLLYSAFTYYCGFKVNSGEYKLMGLAPYGKPLYAEKIKAHLIDIKNDGSFRLDMSYFAYCTDLTMTNRKFHELFGGPPRDPESRLTQRDMDLAASIQLVLEEVLLKITKNLHQETGLKNLCLAGGVALNCVANGKILKESGFENIWIQPAAGDAGAALGAALLAYYQEESSERNVMAEDSMQGSFLGPEYSEVEICQRLKNLGAVFTEHEEVELVRIAAKDLSGGQALAWFQGRMEFGPRALGARSILGDPRDPKTQSVLNQKIKFRESFRPFAPIVLEEKVTDWFELEAKSPYMLLVARLKKHHLLEKLPEEEALEGIDLLRARRSEVPAITHVDNSARVQSVSAKTNPLFHRLLKAFEAETGCPILVNTSFNIRGEPIVNTPEEAFRCFMGTDLDALVIGKFLLKKSEQNPALRHDYRGMVAKD